MNNHGEICNNLKAYLYDFLQSKIDKRMLVIFGDSGSGKNLVANWLEYTFNSFDAGNSHMTSFQEGERWFPSKGAIFRKIIGKIGAYNDISNSLLIFENYEKTLFDDDRRTHFLNLIYAIFFYYNKDNYGDLKIVITCDSSYIDNKDKIYCDYISLPSIADELKMQFD